MTGAAASRQHLIIPGAGTAISVAQSAKSHDLKREKGEQSSQQQKTGAELTHLREILVPAAFSCVLSNSGHFR